MTDLHGWWFPFWNFTKLYVIAILCLFSQVICKTKRHPAIDVTANPGTVAIVTGGARGIGFEISCQLARIGVHVIMGVRSKSAAKHAIHQIKKEIPKSRVEAIELNLCSFASVHEFTNEFLAKKLPLNILINNAGVMLCPYAITVDGHEEQLQVNYLSHYLLTGLLMPSLQASGLPQRHSRIVNLSSHAHFVGHINMNDFSSREVYSSHAAYSQSKRALLLFATSLQHHMPESSCVTINCVHPGVVDTDLFRHTSTLTRMMSMFVKWMYKTPEQGSYTPLYVALATSLNGLGGAYYDNCEKMASSSEDNETENVLWECSRQWVGLPTNWADG